MNISCACMYIRIYACVYTDSRYTYVCVTDAYIRWHVYTNALMQIKNPRD